MDDDDAGGGGLRMSAMARVRHEEFEIRRDLDAARLAGDEDRIRYHAYQLGLALHRRAGLPRCCERVRVQRIAAALLLRAEDGPWWAVDRNTVAVARYRMRARRVFFSSPATATRGASPRARVGGRTSGRAARSRCWTARTRPGTTSSRTTSRRWT